MTAETSGVAVSFQRAFESAIQSLTVLRAGESEVPRILDEDLLKSLLVESFAHQFEEDISVLEKRVAEILEAKARKSSSGGRFNED